MFDIGFTELLLIAVVALIVIGPERLPKVARTAGHLFGRMQRYVNDVKADISREMEFDELRKLRTGVEDTARSFEQSVQQGLSETDNELNRVAQCTQSQADPETAPAPESEPAPAEREPSAVPASPQLDLALEPSAEASTRKPA
ncbi:MAG: Sec-independent protein translocase protein TatB [Betaproteobacteria bacterium]|nr:Sec-independent protein translocase protein TatB [Betaproteobacteria bacterium]MDH3435571.1 Sec-independent protein translocase protein TatB [Betaproteobacteria bacterium]